MLRYPGTILFLTTLSCLIARIVANDNSSSTSEKNSSITPQIATIKRGSTGRFKGINLGQKVTLYAHARGMGTLQINAMNSGTNKSVMAQFDCDIGWYEPICVLPVLPTGSYDLQLTNNKFSYETTTVELFESEEHPAIVNIKDREVIRVCMSEQSSEVTLKIVLSGRQYIYVSEKISFSLLSRFDSIASDTRTTNIDEVNQTLELRISTLLKNGSVKPLTKREPSNSNMNILITLFSSDEDHCVANDCTYLVNIKSQGLSDVLLVVAIDPEVPHYDVTSQRYQNGGYLAVTEQVYSDKPNYYMVTVYDPLNIEVSLELLDGNPDLYVNLNDALDHDYSKYTFKSASNLHESIMINQHQLFNKQPQEAQQATFHIVIASNVTSVYKLKIVPKLVAGGEAYPIALNSMHTGVLNDNEVANFNLIFSPDFPQTVTFFARMSNTKGNPDLYITDCPSNTTCFLSREDIAIKEAAAKNSSDNNISSSFVYSENTIIEDSIYFTINMVPGGAAELSTTSAGTFFLPFRNNLPVSQYNKICISVLGRKTKTSETSDYALSVSGRFTHSLVTSKAGKRMLLIPGDTVYFVFQANNIPDGADGVELIFSMMTGDCLIYLSTSDKYPSEAFNDVKLDGAKHQANAQVKILRASFSLDSMAFTQNVYIAVVPSTPLGINVRAKILQKPIVQGQPFLLIPDAAVERYFNNTDQFIVKHKFDVFRFDSLEGTFIVDVTSIQGSVKACILLSAGSELGSQTPKDCTVLESYGGTLVAPLTSGQGQLSTFFIFVEPMFADMLTEGRFGIAYSIIIREFKKVEEISQLNKPFDITLVGSKQQIYFVDFIIRSAEDRLKIVVNSISGRPFGVLTTLIKKNAESWMGKVMKYSFGSIISDSVIGIVRGNPQDALQCVANQPTKMDKINNLKNPIHCRLYILVSTDFSEFDINIPNHFRILVVSPDNTLPITLPEGQRLLLPISNYTLQLYSNIQASASVQVSSEDFNLKLVVKSGADIKMAYGYGTLILPIGPVSSTSGNLNGVEINVTKQDTDGQNQGTFPYDYAVNYESPFIKVSVSGSIEEIKISETVHGSVLKRMYKYFTVTKSKLDELLIVVVPRIDCETDMYVSEGRNLPTIEDHLYKSVNYRDDEVVIPESSSVLSIDDHMFTIGVYAPKADCAFTLTTYKDNVRIQTVESGKLYTASSTPKHRVYVKIRIRQSIYNRTLSFFYDNDFNYQTNFTVGKAPENSDVLMLQSSEISPLNLTQSGTDLTVRRVTIPIFPGEYGWYVFSVGNQTESIKSNILALNSQYNIVSLPNDGQYIRLVLTKGEIVSLQVPVSTNSESGNVSSCTIRFLGQLASFQIGDYKNKSALKDLYLIEKVSCTGNPLETVYLECVADDGYLIIWLDQNGKSIHLHPGDTKLLRIDSGTSKDMHLFTYEMSPGKSIRSAYITVTEKHGESSSLMATFKYPARNGTADIKQLEFSKSVDLNYRSVQKASVPIENGILTLHVAQGQSGKDVRAAIRLVINDIDEIEENGIYSKDLLPGESRVLQMTETQRDTISIKLKICQGALTVYKSNRFDYLEESAKVLLFQEWGNYDPRPVDQSISITGYYYLHLINPSKTEKTSFWLSTTVETYTNSYIQKFEKSPYVNMPPVWIKSISMLQKKPLVILVTVGIPPLAVIGANYSVSGVVAVRLKFHDIDSQDDEQFSTECFAHNVSKFMYFADKPLNNTQNEAIAVQRFIQQNTKATMIEQIAVQIDKEKAAKLEAYYARLSVSVSGFVKWEVAPKGFSHIEGSVLREIVGIEYPVGRLLFGDNYETISTQKPGVETSTIIILVVLALIVIVCCTIYLFSLRTPSGPQISMAETMEPQKAGYFVALQPSSLIELIDDSRHMQN